MHVQVQRRCRLVVRTSRLHREDHGFNPHHRYFFALFTQAMALGGGLDGAQVPVSANPRRCTSPSQRESPAVHESQSQLVHESH